MKFFNKIILFLLLVLVLGVVFVFVAFVLGFSLFCPARAGRPRSCHAPLPAPARGGAFSLSSLGFPFSARLPLARFRGRALRALPQIFFGRAMQARAVVCRSLSIQARATALACVPRATARGTAFCVLNLDSGLVAMCESYKCAVNLASVIGGSVFNLDCPFSQVMLSKCRALWNATK